MENYISLDCDSKYGKYRYEKSVCKRCYKGEEVIENKYVLERFVVNEWVEVEDFYDFDYMVEYAKELGEAIIKSIPSRKNNYNLCTLKRREMLFIIAPCFMGYENIIDWDERTNEIVVHTLYSTFSAENVHGTYGFITRWR